MKKKTKREYTFRNMMNDLHLWLGILSAVVLFLVCLTGTIYTFRTEIEAFIEPEKYKISHVSEKRKALSELVEVVETTYQRKVQRISVFEKATKPVVLSIAAKEKDKRGENVYVNPYTAEIVGAGQGPASEFFMTVFRLHRWLLLDMKIGRPIVGIATLVFVVLSFTGLVLWFPKKKKNWRNFKPGFKIKFNANWKRINHDLHNTLGFYALLPIVVMSLTGLCWSFDWFRDGLGEVLGAKVFAGRNEVKPTSAFVWNEQISIDQAVDVAHRQLPFEYRSMTITLPKEETGSIEVNKNSKNRFNETVFDRVFIDQYTGEVIRTDWFADQTIGAKIASSVRALHFGDIYGTFSKVIYFISCLIATSLPVTGILIWTNKMKKKPKKNNITL